MRTVLRWIATLLLVALAEGSAMAAPPPPEVAKTVTFIFLSDDIGNIRIQNDVPFANGTGFFVIVPNENGAGGYGYLVTAKHVLKDKNGAFFKRVFIRVNDKRDASGFIAIELVPAGVGQNIFFHTDPTVDIAVIPAMPRDDLFDFLAIPSSMIKSKEDFKRGTIKPGSDVFFVGLFALTMATKLIHRYFVSVGSRC
jgi:hypothetical protein